MRERKEKKFDLHVASFHPSFIPDLPYISYPPFSDPPFPSDPLFYPSSLPLTKKHSGFLRISRVTDLDLPPQKKK
jgi:hypothetical protein